VICTHPSENAICTEEGARAASTVTPVSGNLTCEQCLATLLTPEQLSKFLAFFGVSFEDFCTIVLRQGVNKRDLEAALFVAGVTDIAGQRQIFQCLVNAGVTIPGFPEDFP
jgi:hypothetical protein